MRRVRPQFVWPLPCSQAVVFGSSPIRKAFDCAECRWTNVDDVSPKKINKIYIPKNHHGKQKPILGPKTLIFHGFGAPRQLHRWTPLRFHGKRSSFVPLFRAKKSPQPPAPAAPQPRFSGGIRLVLQRGSESNDFSYLGRFGCRRDPDSFLGGIKTPMTLQLCDTFHMDVSKNRGAWAPKMDGL